MVNYKNMDADYENIENPDGMNKMQKAFGAVVNPDSATQDIVNILVDVATSILSTASLFALITTLSPILLISMVTLTLVQHFINRAGHRWQYRNAEKWASLDASSTISIMCPVILTGPKTSGCMASSVAAGYFF
jgi:ATP-binding cassette subfamily B protein